VEGAWTHDTSKLAPQMSLTQSPRRRAATCGGWSPARRTRREWDTAEAAALTAAWEARRGGGGTGTAAMAGWLLARPLHSGAEKYLLDEETVWPVVGGPHIRRLRDGRLIWRLADSET